MQEDFQSNAWNNNRFSQKSQATLFNPASDQETLDYGVAVLEHPGRRISEDTRHYLRHSAGKYMSYSMPIEKESVMQ